MSSHVSNNGVPTGEIAALIHIMDGALAAPEAPPQLDKPIGAVSAHASVKPGHLVSMIDDKPCKVLRQHISQHRYTRETFGLPHDNSMVPSVYAEQRRSPVHKIGLGRKSAVKPEISDDAALGIYHSTNYDELWLHPSQIVKVSVEREATQITNTRHGGCFTLGGVSGDLFGGYTFGGRSRSTTRTTERAFVDFQYQLERNGMTYTSVIPFGDDRRRADNSWSTISRLEHVGG